MTDCIRSVLTRCALIVALCLWSSSPLLAQHQDWLADAVQSLEGELVTQYGEDQRQRARDGLRQLSSLWRAEDGGRVEFEAFVKDHFAKDEAALSFMLQRFDSVLEKIDGHSNEIEQAVRMQTDLDRGPIAPYDKLLSTYDPYAHLNEDFFKSKLAFTVILNFRNPPNRKSVV